RITASRHGPDDFFHIGRIDVLIDNDRETAEISCGMALRSDHARLASMSRITLLDGHYGKQTGIPFRRTPNADDVRHARSVQFLPNHGRSPEALIEGRFRWGPARWGTCHDRIIAKINSVHAYDRLFSHRAGIIPGPFAKRPLRFPIRRQTFSLDNHFFVRRNRKNPARPTKTTTEGGWRGGRAGA